MLSATDGSSCSCRYLFIADIRRVSISEGVVVKTCPSLSAPKAHLTGEYPPVLKPLLREEHAKETQDASVNSGWWSANFLDQRFDDSDQILQVCCETMKFNRSRQETNTSNTCPVLQTKHPPVSEINNRNCE